MFVPALLANVAAAAAIFLVAPSLPGLLPARVVSGVSVGLTTATATAYLAELHGRTTAVIAANAVGRSWPPPPTSVASASDHWSPACSLSTRRVVASQVACCRADLEDEHRDLLAFILQAGDHWAQLAKVALHHRQHRCVLDAMVQAQMIAEVLAAGLDLGCKHATPAIIEAGGGSVINTGSISGLSGEIILHAYAASKAGVHSLTQCVATTYGPQGVRCNAIGPGLIWTQVTEAFWTQAERDAWFEQHLGGRMGRPEDIAAAVVYLASDEAEHVTGQILRIDGRFLSHYPTVPRIRELRNAASLTAATA